MRRSWGPSPMYLGRANHELESLATHGLDEDGDVKGAAAVDDELVRRLSGLDLHRNVALHLAREALLDVAGGDELPLLARKGGRVDDERHAHRGIINLVDRGKQKNKKKSGANAGGVRGHRYRCINSGSEKRYRYLSQAQP